MVASDPYINEHPNSNALSNQTIYQQLQSAQPDTGREALYRVLTEADGVNQNLDNLTKSLDRLQWTWQAPSTDLAVQAVHDVREYVGEIGNHAGTLHQCFEAYVDQLDTAKAQVPEPAEPPPDIPIVGPLLRAWYDVEHQRRTQEARAIYQRAYQVAVVVDHATPGFDVPPPRVVNQHSVEDAPLGQPGDATGSRPTAPAAPPATPTSPGVPQPPAGNPPAPPTLPTPPVPPGSPGSPAVPVLPAPTPPGAAGGGGNPGPVVPPPNAPPGGPSNAHPGGGLPVAPPPATAGNHGAAAGRGPGVTTGRGSGVPSSQLVSTSPPAARQASGSAGRTAGVGGPMMGAGAGRGGSQEDTEHRRAPYLVADDPNELIGPLDKVAPPVIGDDPRRGES